MRLCFIAVAPLPLHGRLLALQRLRPVPGRCTAGLAQPLIFASLFDARPRHLHLPTADVSRPPGPAESISVFRAARPGISP